MYGGEFQSPPTAHINVSLKLSYTFPSSPFQNSPPFPIPHRWQTEITSVMDSSELPEMRYGAATEHGFCRYWPPRDAFRSMESLRSFSLDRNASRGGQYWKKPPSVSIPQRILGSSDETNVFVISVSQRYEMQLQTRFRFVMDSKRYGRNPKYLTWPVGAL